LTEKILLGENVKLDLQELITGRTFLSSISRYGKSWTARRIVEQVFGRTGVVILDPEGEYSTLRDKYPLLIISKDVPLVPEAAEYLADQILEHELSAIVDLSDPQLEILAGQEFVSRFIDRFIALETKMRKPYLWVLEECDEFAPEKGTFKSASLQSVIKLTKKGGKRGLGVLVLTQRPAFVSKYVISQCSNKLVGRMEWPDDIAVIKRYLRISDKISDKLSKVEKGEFYVSGDFVAKESFVKVGPVETKHLGATPEVVPPAPRELKETLAKLSEALPKIVQEKLAPAVPKVAEIEARIKEKLEGAWQARVQRVEKERDAVKRKVEAKYEVEIADLRRKLDEAVRHAALKGEVTDLLSHPLVQKNLEKLNAKQRGLVELLETKGPQDAEHVSLFLETSPKNVPTFVYDINRKIPKLIENVQGRYVSRLAKLFPVTEELKAEAREIENLKTQISQKDLQIRDLVKEMDRLKLAHQEATFLFNEMKKERDAEHQNFLNANRALNEATVRIGQLESQLKKAPTALPAPRQLPTALPTIDETRIREIVREELSAQTGSGIPVDVTLKRTLSEFNVSVNKEKFEVDESSWEGKLLARGLEGFFDEPKGIGKIMQELVRRYNVGDSGGNRTTVNDRLAMLVDKGILDRRQESGQWVYFATPEFKKRVKPSP